MGYIAPRTTLITASTTQGQVAADANIVVYGILIEGTAAGRVTFLDKDGTNKFFMSVGADDSENIRIPFRADNGLRVTTPASVTATIFHSHPGT